MDKCFYNTYTISDSDDSVIIEDCPTKNITLPKNDILMSPEEPEFFNQVMQRTKRKKSLSPEIIAKHKNVHIIERQKISTIDIEESEQNNHKPNKQNVIKTYESTLSGVTERNISTTIINEEIPELLEPKKRKRLTKDEVEKKKNEEKIRKDAKKKLTEELKRINPKDCMKYMTVHIDINLQNYDYSDQIISEIQSTDAKYKIELNSILSNSIKWSRQISDTVSKDEDFILLIWDFDYVNNLIISDQLLEKINHLKLNNMQPSIIIYSTTEQLKKSKSKNGQLSRSNMLNKLNQIMLSCQVSFRFIENKNDIGLAILYYTKSIAQKPYKLNKYKEEQDGCDWYASGHTKNCVTVDKNGIGLSQLWRQMLSQFPLCALETSEAIAATYGSPFKLLEAYDKCSSRLEGETLLQDIPVRRGFGPLASSRRIGPELSKKIYIFFTDNTGCTTLSQES